MTLYSCQLIIIETVFSFLLFPWWVSRGLFLRSRLCIMGFRKGKLSLFHLSRKRLFIFKKLLWKYVRSLSVPLAVFQWNEMWGVTQEIGIFHSTFAPAFLLCCYPSSFALPFCTTNCRLFQLKVLLLIKKSVKCMNYKHNTFFIAYFNEKRARKNFFAERKFLWNH